MAKRIGPGDAVFVPRYVCPTAEVVVFLGANTGLRRLLADTFNIDPYSLEAAITVARRAGLDGRGDPGRCCFGPGPADYRTVGTIARRHGLYGPRRRRAVVRRRRLWPPAGGLGDIGATSFSRQAPRLLWRGRGDSSPTTTTSRPTCGRSAVHGQGKDKYDNVAIGGGGALDTLRLPFSWRSTPF